MREQNMDQTVDEQTLVGFIVFMLVLTEFVA